MVGQTAFFCEEGGGDTFVFLLTTIPEADIFRRDQLWRVSCLVMWMLVSLSRALVQSPSSRSDAPLGSCCLPMGPIPSMVDELVAIIHHLANSF